MMAASTRPLGLSRGQRRFSSKELFGLACTSAQRPLAVCPWLIPGWKVVAIRFTLISLAGFVPSSAEQSRSGLSLLPQKRKHCTLRTGSVPAPHYIYLESILKELFHPPQNFYRSSTSVRIADEVLQATRIEMPTHAIRLSGWSKPMVQRGRAKSSEKPVAHPLAPHVAAPRRLS